MIRSLPSLALVSMALVAWGVGTEHLALACAMAVSHVAAARLPYRLSSSSRAISWSNDGTLIFLLVAAFWQYFQIQGSPAVIGLSLLSLCPIFLYPKLFFSALQGSAPSAAASRDGAAVARHWLESNIGFSRANLDRRKPVSFLSAYFFLCLFTAAITLPSLSGTVVFCSGALAYGALHGWSFARAKRRGVLAALAACSISLAGAWVGQGAIQKAQEAAESYLSQSWINRQDFYNGNVSQTAIGRRGSIDNGGRLVARVDWPLSSGYLRNGLFSDTSNGLSWNSRPRGAPSTSLPVASTAGKFRLAKDPRPLANASSPLSANLSLSIRHDRSVIPLPLGVTQMAFPAMRIDITEMGLPLAVGVSGFASFQTTFYAGYDPQPMASSADLDVPIQLEGLVDNFLSESGAQGLPPAQAAAAIRSYFSKNWTYSLSLDGSDGRPRSIARFLTVDRAGHCEYFATISTLAMRRLGYPARYATGFLVHERNADENLFWVRARDAHAWSTFWNGQSWQTLDATPPGQGEELSWLDGASDFFSKLQYHLDAIDLSGALGPQSSNLLLGVAALLAALLIARARFSKSVKTIPKNIQSELLTAQIERLTGLARRPDESGPDFWIRASDLIPARRDSLRALAAERSKALFQPVGDLQASLERSESKARAERRALPRRLPSKRS